MHVNNNTNDTYLTLIYITFQKSQIKCEKFPIINPNDKPRVSYMLTAKHANITNGKKIH